MQKMLQEMIPLSEHLRSIYANAISSTQAEAIFFSSFDQPEYVMKKLSEAGICFKVLLGKYNSTYEISYVTSVDNIEWLFSSELLNGQESVLLLNADGYGYLMYNQFSESGELRLDPLGEIIEIDKSDALNRDAFTFDPEHGLYYGTTEKAA